jgi:autotransporter-associated beta strand protein
MQLGITDGIINADASRTIAINVVISEANANSGFTKTGAGTLTLGAANTFTGTFTATGGTTNLGIDGALGSASAVSIASGSTLRTSVTTLTDAINNSAAITLNGTLDVSGGTETVASLAGTDTGAFLTIGKKWRDSWRVHRWR